MTYTYLTRSGKRHKPSRPFEDFIAETLEAIQPQPALQFRHGFIQARMVG